MKLPLKLTILIMVIFGLTILGMALWRPVKVRYYASKLESSDKEIQLKAARTLFDMGSGKVVLVYCTENLEPDKMNKDMTDICRITSEQLLKTGDINPVFGFYSKVYNSEDLDTRFAVVNYLCGLGGSGKEVMHRIFRNRCLKEMVKISAGSFMMGSDKGRDYEKPVHKVTMSSFYMDKYEVTNEDYDVFVKCSGHKAPWAWEREGGKFPDNKELHPVITVTWHDAKAFADWLGMKLPTEAQWEYACRAGSETEYYFGDSEAELTDYAWCSENTNKAKKRVFGPMQVGQKKPNKWNLYDMHGNVWEWCSDWFDSDYYSTSPAKDPEGPSSGQAKILRGGSHSESITTRFHRSAERGGRPPTLKVYDVGFRCVRDVK